VAEYQDGEDSCVGIVKWFDDEKGYGFILAAPAVKLYDKSEDKEVIMDNIFVHYSGVASKGHRQLIAGQKVSFHVEPGKKSGRLQAVMVEVTETVKTVTVPEQYLLDLKAEVKRLKEQLKDVSASVS
jgi:CspA family cold shock protein